MGLHVGCLLLVVAVTLLKGAAAENYTVGDDLGWNIPPLGSIAYKTWANKKSFQIGDTIGNYYLLQKPNYAEGIHGEAGGSLP